MNIKLREYTAKDKEQVKSLLTDLHQYISSIDPYKKVAVKEGYGESKLVFLLKKLNETEGKFLVAENQGEIVATGVGVVMKPGKLTKTGSNVGLTGWIMSVCVKEEHRRQGIGGQIIKQLENFLIDKGCEAIRLQVFEQNKKAHDIYENMGYDDRSREMIKFVN